MDKMRLRSSTWNGDASAGPLTILAFSNFSAAQCSSPRILCLGMSALDAIYRVPAIPTTPTKVLGVRVHRMRRRHGGQCQRRGRAARRRCPLLGRVGADALGDRILAELAAEASTSARCGGSRAASPRPRRSWWTTRASAWFAPITIPASIADPSGCRSTAGRMRRGARRRALAGGRRGRIRSGRAHGVITVFDGDVGPPRRAARSGPARDPCRLLAARVGAATGFGLPGQGLAAMAGTVPGIVGVTLGADGFLWRDGGVERRTRAPKVNVVDTLAAGDVWHGAFTLMLAEGHDVATASAFRQCRGGDQMLAGRGPARCAAPRGSGRDARRAID